MTASETHAGRSKPAPDLTWADRLEHLPPHRILAAASERFSPRLAFATGFGAEGCVLVDMAARHRLAVDVFTIDTGELFPETYELWRRLEARYGIAIRGIHTAGEDGAREWERDPDGCCERRKVRPLRAALAGFDAWVTAIRRDQTSERATAKVVEWDAKFGLVKVNPLAAWSSRDVWAYVREHGVPTNPLHEKGYASIGCAPCTTPVAAGEDPRAGRWRGKAKTECGLHARPAAAPLAAAEIGGATEPARPSGGYILWLTGLSGAGKSTLSRRLLPALRAERPVELLDGDEVRTYLSKGLGFSREDRDTNIRRIGYVARLLARNGVAVVTAAISPYAATRDEVRRLAEDDGIPFVEVHVSAPIQKLAERDVKGLYRKALAGEIPNFTGVSDPYEPPASPALVVHTDREAVHESAAKVLAVLRDRGLLSAPAAIASVA